MNTMAGTLSAAIIAGLIVIFMKIYDRYHQQSIREYKDVLDIQKNIPESDYKSKEQMKEIVANKSAVFFETQQLKDIENSKGTIFREAFYYLKVIGLVSVFSFFALLAISCTLFYTGLLIDVSSFTPWISITAISFIGCGITQFCVNSSFRRELEMKDENEI